MDSRKKQGGENISSTKPKCQKTYNAPPPPPSDTLLAQIQEKLHEEISLEITNLGILADFIASAV